MISFVDSLGLLQEGTIVVLRIPAVKMIVAFRVVSRLNRGFEHIDYGPLPIKAGSTAKVLTTGSQLQIPQDYVLPPFTYIEIPLEPRGVLTKATYKDENILYFDPVDHFDKPVLYHFIIRVSPEFVKLALVADEKVQTIFMKHSRVVDMYFGMDYGKKEIMLIPGIEFKLGVYNPTSLTVSPSARLTFAIYEIEPISDRALIEAIQQRRIFAYWYTVPLFEVTNAEDLKRTIKKWLHEQGIVEEGELR